MKLYLVYMGGVSKERLIEDHEIILLVANDLEEAKLKAKKKNKLEEEVHVEKGGLEEIKKVSDYSKI